MDPKTIEAIADALQEASDGALSALRNDAARAYPPTHSEIERGLLRAAVLADAAKMVREMMPNAR